MATEGPKLPQEHERREADAPARDLAGLAVRVRRHLRTRLEPHRHYHDVTHTFDDVLPAADRLAAAEGLAPHERLLVRAAALLHDTGYVEGPAGHEQLSARIAAAWLPDAGFSADEVARVETLILATRLGSEPATLAERVLADADLGLLGREDYWDRASLLRREWAGDGTSYDEAAWLRHQLRFLSAHRYHTVTARRLWGAGKEANVRRLRALLSDGLGTDAGPVDGDG